MGSLNPKKHNIINRIDSPKDVTIVVPVYNEDKEMFRKCISSLSLQKSQIIVIGDSSLEPYRSITEEFGGKFIYQQIRRGKRNSISNGIKYVTTKYVLFVDSDTIIPNNTVISMLSKFNNKIAGVGTAVSANIEKNNILSYSSEFFEKLKEVVFRTMSLHGNVMVLDGRCAMYNTNIIKDFMLSNEYTENKIFGKKSLLAEDRHLTSYIIKRGYKAVIDYDIAAVTAPQKNFNLMFKQMVRWSRAGYLYFFKELADGTYFRRGMFYSFEMTYMYIFPIALLFLSLFKLDIISIHGLSHYLSFQANHLSNLLNLNFSGFSKELIFYMWVQALTLIGLIAFTIAVAVRITKGIKMKTLAVGAIVLIMMFAASIYGLLTIWKQNEWLTR
jgi:cellulose synthase/poly-beta-1,6-N-acetylglucosamine synthase-like glycosyltransferase